MKKTSTGGWMAETHHRVPASTHIHLLGLGPVQSHMKDKNQMLFYTLPPIPPAAGTLHSALNIQ